jgi:hypothetical protein
VDPYRLLVYPVVLAQASACRASRQELAGRPGSGWRSTSARREVVVLAERVRVEITGVGQVGPVERRQQPLGDRNIDGVIGGYHNFQAHNVFVSTGEVLVVDSVLRFRSHDEIERSLAACGLTVEQVYGDWQHGALTNTSRGMVFVARRSE